MALFLLAVTPTAGWAQADRKRSDTGRSLPPPVEDPTEEQRREQAEAPVRRWFVGLGLGMVGGGDLWRVETVNGAAVPWDSAVRFSSSRFSATLSNNFGAGLMVGRQLNDSWSLRLDAASSRMDITAEALQGQQAGVFGYDRLTMRLVGLTGEVKLARLKSAPYATIGVLMNSMTAAREDELDQTQYGYRLGLGYLHQVAPEISLRAEARFSRTGFSAGSFTPSTEFVSQPELDISFADDVDLFELVLIIQANL